LIKALGTYLERLTANGARIRVVGDLSMVSEPVRKALSDAAARTAHNTKITLTVAFNYGGRWDIVQACKRAMLDGVVPDALNEAVLGRYMAMSDVVDPDLLIRTGGEMRLSNFLLWQSAYSELYFTDRLWPDFDEAELDKALRVFALRERRFGDVGSSADDVSSSTEGGAEC
jgi:undecaprenyl diphosphate synthase